MPTHKSTKRRIRRPGTARGARFHGVLLCGLALSVLAGTAGHAGDGEVAVNNLQDVLTGDSRESAAACGQVSYSRADSSSPAALKVSPPNPDGQTIVDVFLFVLAIDEIDTLSNSFRFEGYAGLIWCDPRHAFDAAAEGADRRLVSDERAIRYLEDVWWPGIFAPTHLGEPEISANRVILYSDGTVTWQGKIGFRLAANYDFADFPVDAQTLHVPIQSLVHHSDTVRMQVEWGRVGLSRQFDLPEWRVLGVRAVIDNVSTSDGRTSYPRFVLKIDVARKIGYYVWKILLPMAMIFSVAWASFWMRDAPGQRQRMSATGVLSLIAFQFVAASVVPRVPYLTLLDMLMTWSFLVVAGSMACNVWSDREYRKSAQQGVRADRRLRLIYPLVYAGGLVALGAIRLLA